MKNVNNLGKRLLALLIVAAMVVGQIPFGAVAADEDAAPATNVELQLNLSCELKENADAGADEGSDSQNATYKAELFATNADGVPELVTEGVTFLWASTSDDADAKAKASFDTSEESLECTVTYQGRTLTGTVSFTNRTAFVNWTASATVSDVVLGNYFTVNDLVYGTGSGITEDVVAECVSDYSDGNGNYVVNDPALAGTTVNAANIVLKKGNVVVYTVPITAAVTMNPVSITVNGKAPEQWYSQPVELEVSMEAPGATSSNCLPAVYVDGTAVTTEWISDAEHKVWTNTVSVADQTKSTIAVQNSSASCTVGVDAQEPTVEIVGTPYNDNKQTKVRFRYKTGISGASSYVVNDETVTPSEITGPDEEGWYTAKVSLNKAVEQAVSVAVVSAAGLAGNAGSVNPPVSELNVGYRLPAVLEEKGGVSYVSAESNQIVVTVDNAIAPYTITVTDKDGKDVGADVSGNVATVTVPEGGTVNGLKVLVQDGEGREKTDESMTTVYGLDNQAPVIAFTINGEAYSNETQYSNETYMKEKQNYTVTIKDNVSFKDDLSGVSAYYYLANDDNPHPINLKLGGDGSVSGSLTVEDGMHLVRMVANATDETGNTASTKTLDTNLVVDTTAPKITAKASVTAVNGRGEPVEGFKIKSFCNVGTDAEPKWFAWIDKPDTNKVEEDWTVTLNVDFFLEESNPDAATMQAWVDYGTYMMQSVSVTVSENYTAALNFNISARDKAGWGAVGACEDGALVILAEGEDEDECKKAITVKGSDGGFQGTIHVDRRTPGSNAPTLEVVAPEITVSADTALTASNGNPLYKDNFSFRLKVVDSGIYKDGALNESDSGVSSITWSLSDGKQDKNIFDMKETNLTIREDGTYVLPVTLDEGEVEWNDVMLTVVATDKVGNSYTFVHYFAVDNKAPEIQVDYGDKQAVNGCYFPVKRTAHITISDLNLNTASYVVNGTDIDIEKNGTEATIDVPFNTDGEYTLSVRADDLAGNDYTTVSPNFVIDLTNPKFTVEKTVQAGKSYIQSGDAVDYYNGEVTYAVSIDEDNLKKATVWYVITDSAGTVITDKTVSLNDGKTYRILLKNGQILTNLELYAQDQSGRYGDVSSKEPFTKESSNKEPFNDDKGNIQSYSGNDVVVDTTPAVVTLEKTVADGGKFVQTYDGNDYYNAPVTYTLSIKDCFLSNLNDSKIWLQVNYLDGSESFEWSFDDFTATTEGRETTYSKAFSVEDGQRLRSINLQVIDNAGNITKEIAVSEVVKASTFYYNEKTKTNNYTGNAAIVDVTNPKAVLTIDGNVESFYTFNGVAYVKLAEAVSGPSGVLAPKEEETVRMTIQITDKNLTLDKENKNAVVDNIKDSTGSWSGTPRKNADSTATYTDEITVAADGTGLFTFDLTVLDLAGNALTEEDIEVTAINNTTLGDLVKYIKPSEGKFGTTISVDRRRPSTVTGDNNAPVITIVPTIGHTTSNNDLELFNGAFDFAMTVTDGEAGSYNSGLGSVSWVLEDPTGFVYAPENAQPSQADGTYTNSFTIPVRLNSPSGESNSVKLTITAVDKVGNVTTYVREFAVDNQAPRVTVSYDNNSVMNERYFKANRVVTVRVQDINFNAATTPITTQVGTSGWTQTADGYVTTCAYTVDGEYTLDMSCTDLAGNASGIDFTNGGANAAPKAFTLDKTAPVISVSYNPASPIGKDETGVSYYDKDLNVSVSIREVNFRAADVNASMGANNSLSGWYSSGSNHTSSTVYTEGNGYSFYIEYTDLAGNPAVSYSSDIFSVDTHAPTIEITKGSMTTEELNIVREDLLLGFTINDGESNLSGFDIEVVHLNNEFKQSVVEGRSYYTVSDAGNKTTVTIDFAEIAKEKGNDGIYTVQITAQDYAGHNVRLSPELSFSLNRFGSTFMTDDVFTSTFLTPSENGTVYQNAVSNKLVIKEINPNRVWQDSDHAVEGSVITLAVNGSSIILEKDVDYTVTETKEGTGSNKWYVYTYEINTANFLSGEELVDGNYTILLYGEDEAGNKNTNESNEFGAVQMNGKGEYSGKIAFTLDHKAPVITTVGIEPGKSYDAEYQRVQISLSDNSPAAVQVYLNGEAVELSESMDGLASNEAWLAIDPETGRYVLNVPESNSKQTVTVVTTDAAGNTAEKTIENFLVTSNFFVRAINNPIFVCGFLFLILALIIFIILILKKKKNKEEQAA